MALTVGFDATSAARQSAGIGRYTRELLSALSRRPDHIEYRLFYCAGGELHGALPALDGRFRVRALPLSDRVTNAVWHRLRIPVPIQLVTGRFDIFHSPDFTLPPLMGRPSILTVHDLAFLTVPENAFPTLRAYLERVVPRSVRRATHIIAVSYSTARDLTALLDIPMERIDVIHEGVSPVFRPPASREAAREQVLSLGISHPFILSVGTLEPRKNYVRLLEAYARLRLRGCTHDLVIAGRRGWLFEPIFQRLDALGIRAHVRFVQPTDGELAALYGAADVFVYPSLYEGFGIPPLEGMSCGVPVACSDTSSLPEIVGESALMFDPMNVDAIAETVESILADGELAQRLREAGPRQAKRFSWDEAAARTHALYERVAASA